MTITRRTTLQTLGAIGAGTAMAGTVFAAGEHEDDERETDEPADADGEEPAATAAVRVAHFSPDAPNVDVYVDGDQVLSDLAYDEVSPYLEIAPGTYAVEVTAAGDPDTVAFEGDVTFGQAFYTIAAVGELEADTFRPLVLVDAGASLLRVVHGSPDAPAVDVYAAGGESPLVSALEFGDSSNYLPLPAGSYSLEVRPAGEEPADDAAPDDETDVDDTEENGYEDTDENGYDDTDENGYDDNGVADDEDNGYDDTEEAADDEEAAPEEADPDDATEEATDAVATVEADLEEGTAYSAYAIGYLEAGEGDDRELTVTVTVDGPMADDEADPEEEPVDDDPEEEPVDDDPEEEPVDDDPEEEPTDEPEDDPCPGDDDADENGYDDNDTDENGYDDNDTDENGYDDNDMDDNVTDDNDTGC